jgi:hypothetical protein
LSSRNFLFLQENNISQSLARQKIGGGGACHPGTDNDNSIFAHTQLPVAVYPTCAIQLAASRTPHDNIGGEESPKSDSYLEEEK